MMAISKTRVLYFHWLCHQIERGKTDKKFRDFNCELHKMEFISLVPNDDNRAADGVGLRDCFAQETNSDVGLELYGKCTVFEMLIGVAQRMNYILSGPADENKTGKWFWQLIHNLGLKLYEPSDPDIESKKRYNEVAIKKFLNRQYAPSGKGGLFPLNKPGVDQREVEIWYQMMRWIDNLVE